MHSFIDEVARLNATPVQQVSVPDGWRELLCAIEQFFEGAGVSPGPDIELRMATMLAAAPAAPAADAGLVYCFECREIGESDWVACDYSRYLYCQNSPEMDTRVVLAAHRAKGVV